MHSPGRTLQTATFFQSGAIVSSLSVAYIVISHILILICYSPSSLGLYVALPKSLAVVNQAGTARYRCMKETAVFTVREAHMLQAIVAL